MLHVGSDVCQYWMTCFVDRHDNAYPALPSAIAETVAETVQVYSIQESEDTAAQDSQMSHLHAWPPCKCMMKKAQRNQLHVG